MLKSRRLVNRCPPVGRNTILAHFFPKLGTAVEGEVSEEEPSLRLSRIDGYGLARDTLSVVVLFREIVRQCQPIEHVPIEGIGPGCTLKLGDRRLSRRSLRQGTPD
jgi:hypothetical protein